MAIVTLLTDFGHRDPYVGIVKGVILRVAGQSVDLVDLCHSVPPQDVETASFFLERSWSWFPEGTLHLVVVDPGVGSGRDVLLLEASGHLFLAPDNGLLDSLARLPGARLARVVPERVQLATPSATFHGRDIFAPTVGRLISGARPEDLTEPLDPSGTSPGALQPLPEPRRNGTVRLVDHFGNLVTDLEDTLPGLEPGACRIRVEGRSLLLARTFSDVPVGEPLAFIGSYGLVEIAVRDGSAAELMGLGRGAAVEIEDGPGRASD